MILDDTKVSHGIVECGLSADPSRMLGERAGEDCAGDRDRQTDRPTDRPTNRQTDGRTARRTDAEIVFIQGQKATLGTADLAASVQIHQTPQTDRQTDRETDRQTDRETDRQTDR